MNERNKKLLLKLRKNKYTTAVQRFNKKKRTELIIVSMLVALFIFSLWFINSSNIKLKNINVSGLNQIEKTELLNFMNINEDVKIWKVKSSELENNVKSKYNIVSNIEVETKLLNTINIKVEERKILALEKNDNNLNIILDNGEVFNGEFRNKFSIPIMENFSNNTYKRENVVRNLSKLNMEILNQISEIVNIEDHEDNINIYMRDGQKIIAKSSDFDSKLNYYQEMSKYIEDKTNTILNLINGAYVETTEIVDRKEKKITQVLNAKVEEKTTEDSKESENDEQKDSN